MPLLIQTGPIPYLLIPRVACPECLYECRTEVLDRLRVKIIHPTNFDPEAQKVRCSRSDTEIIRPLAKFTIEI